MRLSADSDSLAASKPILPHDPFSRTSRDQAGQFARTSKHPAVKLRADLVEPAGVGEASQRRGLQGALAEVECERH